MDTRRKIMEPAQVSAAVERQATLVAGYFDVLTAAHVRRLCEIAASRPGSPLIAIVLDPPEALLTARARGELIAGLAMVDYVVLCGARPLEQVLAELPAGEVVREESGDEERRRNLIEHVQRRHSS
ncbi:MAG: hypothetical protein ABIZ80_24890 [Bryobacteraceae bacterium]